MDKYTQLAKKIKQLADNGMGGEKANAQKMLDDVIRKYNISPESIEDEMRYRCEFIVKINQGRLFNQVVFAVIGKSAQSFISRRYPTHRFVNATKAEEIEIRLRFHFYWKAYVEELEVFFSAFIHKNNLFAHDYDDNYNIELSEGEKEFYKKVGVLMSGMEKKEYIKQLENSIERG